MDQGLAAQEEAISVAKTLSRESFELSRRKKKMGFSQARNPFL
jgi:hypothetical protein